MRHDRGFTLIELLVSLTLVSMVAVTLFASMNGAMKAWNASTNRINASVRTRIGFDLIRKQMACISQVTYPVEMPGGLRGQPIPYFRGEPQRIEFVSLSALRFQENPGLTLVTYFLETQAGRPFLGENERRFTGLESLQQPFPNPTPIPVIEDVADVQFRFLEKLEDPPLSGNVIYNWVDLWDSEARSELPQAIELQVRMQNTGASAAFAIGPQDLRIVVPVLTKPVQPGFGRRQPFNQNNRRGPQGGITPPGQPPVPPPPGRGPRIPR